jgi:hypothetical protein
MSSTPHAGRFNELRFTLEKPARIKALHKRYGHFIRVSRQSVELVFCTSLEYEGEEPAGLFVPSERQIYINIRAAPIEETLIHEIGHAELWEGGFRQRSDWDADVEEQIVETIARGLSHMYHLRLRPNLGE